MFDLLFVSRGWGWLWFCVRGGVLFVLSWFGLVVRYACELLVGLCVVGFVWCCVVGCLVVFYC